MAQGPEDVTVVVLDRDELRRGWRAKVTRPSVGIALAAIGALAILIGYLGVAHEALVAKQIPYLVSGGIGGMVLVAVGAFLLGTDDVRRQLERVEKLESMVADLHRALLQAQGQPGAAATTASTTASTGVSTNGGVPRGALVALAEGSTFHRADCSMVVGKVAGTVADRDIKARGLTPCALCDPAGVSV